MRIVPDSTITLYSNIPISADCDEELVFSSLANQSSYFASHLVVSKVNCQIVKKTGRLRINASATRVKDCNYLSFVNPSWDNKTFYAMITDYNYVNNETIEISYIIDVFQTWMFDVSYSDMYIEREHLSQADYLKAETNPYDPTIYEFKTNENLPIGRDLEKSYYEIDDREFQTGYDGLLIGEAIRHKYNVTGATNVGILMMLSDVNFAALNDGSQGTAGQDTASDFVDIIQDLITNGAADSFYKLSSATYQTLLYVYNLHVPQSNEGSVWSSISGVSLSPMDGSSLTAPVNYIYFGSAASAPSSHSGVCLGQLLEKLTRWNLTDCIVAMYPIPSGVMMTSGASGGEILSATLGSAKTVQNVRNKKLDLYPFCYYRLIAPNGDIKELRMENFKDLQDGQDGATIGMSMDCVSAPNLYVGPIDYRMERASSGVNMNVNEALIYNQFPTLPYSIDGYLSYLASAANSIIGNNTLDYQVEVRQQELNRDKLALRGVGAIWAGVTAFASGLINHFGSAGAVGSALDSGRSAYENYGDAVLQAARVESEKRQRDASYDFIYGGDDSGIRENYKFTLPAHAANIYQQSDGNGMSNFLKCSFFDIIFMRVTLNPMILREYDRYFDDYGYSSGRCGIPRVINYMNGATGNAYLPHWATVNGRQTTYIKTSNCKVEYAMAPVASGIKAMFDHGVRLIKGD